MALVTVQRSPSPSASPDTASSDFIDGPYESSESSLKSPNRSRAFSESYLTVKGAALILPQSECTRTVTKAPQGDIHVHLQSMFYLLRPQDTIRVAVRLESTFVTHIRYMVVVATEGCQDTEETALLGIDINEEDQHDTEDRDVCVVCGRRILQNTAAGSDGDDTEVDDTAAESIAHITENDTTESNNSEKKRGADGPDASIHCSACHQLSSAKRVKLQSDIEKHPKAVKSATIGLVLPILCHSHVRLDGDGGMRYTSKGVDHIFRPVSVQAMWSAYQCLGQACNFATNNNYSDTGLTHTWIQYYTHKLMSDNEATAEWNIMDDLESVREDPNFVEDLSTERAQTEKAIRTNLKTIMMAVDLEEVTSKFLRTQLEEILQKGLKDYRQYIDEQMIIILRQMDAPSEIFDFLYLGSEWNASNLPELQKNGVTSILNVTREIDNFFPGVFSYKNVRLYDVETSHLLPHWDDTFKFISNVKKNNGKVLVHCKMGVSRSASTVIAFAMKEYDWSLEKALKHVKDHRNRIKPNKGFMEQLKVYEGMLDASKQRDNWKSKSSENIPTMVAREIPQHPGNSADLHGHHSLPRTSHVRWRAVDVPGITLTNTPSLHPRSWSPDDSSTDILLKTSQLASDGESSYEGTDDHIDISPEHPDIDGSTDLLMQFTLENCDDSDCGLAARSIDSLDEGLNDVPEVRQKHRRRHSNQAPVVLLSYMDLPETMSLDGACVTESNVDDELFDQDDQIKYRSSFGCYDVSMLGVSIPLSESDDHSVSSTCSSDGDSLADLDWTWDFPHPDSKFEELMTKQRRDRKTALLLSLKGSRMETLAPLDQDVLCDLPPAPTSAPPHINSLRSDTSWIKDIPPSPQAGVHVNEPFVNDGDVATIVDSEGTEPGFKEPSVDLDVTTTISVEEIIAEKCIELEEPIESPSTVDDAALLESKSLIMCQSPVEGTAKSQSTSPNKEHSSDSDGDFIPPGTVKQQTADIEHRLKHGPKSRHGSGGSSECMSPPGTPQSSTSASPLQEEVIEEKNFTCDIYITEDIDVPRGIVKTTKQDLEMKARTEFATPASVKRTSSLKTRSPSPGLLGGDTERGVRRGVKKSRDPERRRTCQPVIRVSTDGITDGTKADDADEGRGDYAPSMDVLLDLTEHNDRLRSKSDTTVLGYCVNGTHGNGFTECNNDTEGAGDAMLLKVGSEMVELEEGTVKKKTQGFEQLYPENPSKELPVESVSRYDTDTAAVPSHAPLHLSLSLPTRDHRSVSPCVQQEGIEIQAGSVLRQKVEMEKKYGSSLSALPLSLASPVEDLLDINGVCDKPGYVNEPDIVWNVGTVRQQTEQLEANKSKSSSRPNSANSVEQRSVEQRSVEQRSVEQRSVEQRSVEQRSGEQRSGEQRSGEQRSGEQRSGEQRSGEQRSGEQRDAERSIEGSPEQKSDLKLAVVTDTVEINTDILNMGDVEKSCTNNDQVESGAPEDNTEKGKNKRHDENIVPNDQTVKNDKRSVIASKAIEIEEDKSEGMIQNQSPKKFAELVGIFEHMSPELGRRLGKRKGGHSTLKRSKTWGSIRDTQGVVVPRKASFSDVEEPTEASCEAAGNIKTNMGSKCVLTGATVNKTDTTGMSGNSIRDVHLTDINAKQQKTSDNDSTVKSTTVTVKNKTVVCKSKSTPSNDSKAKAANKSPITPQSNGASPSKRPTSMTGAMGINQVPMSPEREPNHEGQKPVRRVHHGKSHPLSRLSAEGRTGNKLYNTM